MNSLRILSLLRFYDSPSPPQSPILNEGGETNQKNSSFGSKCRALARFTCVYDFYFYSAPDTKLIQFIALIFIVFCCNDKFNGCVVSAMSTCNSRMRGDVAGD